MDNRQQRTIATFQHILVFLDQHPIRPEPPLLAGMRKSLVASMHRVQALHHEQIAARNKLGKNVEYGRRKMRREHMMPLVRIAKPLLAFAPGAERALRVPHARASAKEVARAAFTMADVLKPHVKLLRSAGFPKDFLKDFRQEAQQLALAIRHADAVRKKHSTATAAMVAELKKAMKTVTVIEGLVMLHFRGDPSMIKHWRERRRVPKRMGRPRQKRAGTSNLAQMQLH